MHAIAWDFEGKPYIMMSIPLETQEAYQWDSIFLFTISKLSWIKTILE